MQPGTRNQLLAAWCGPGFMLVVSLGWAGFAGFLPPHAPAFDGGQVAALYRGHTQSIRFGLLLGMLGSALFIPFSAALAVRMARIEGGFPVWSWTQLAAGATTMLTFALPMMVWAVAAFRPERSPELMLLIDDLAWIPFIGMPVPFMLQPLAVALVGFADTSATPVFPRWACYLSLWIALLVLPAGLVIFFRAGPFAWNGLFGVWIPFFAYGIWMCVMSALLTGAIRRQATD